MDFGMHLGMHLTEIPYASRWDPYIDIIMRGCLCCFQHCRRYLRCHDLTSVCLTECSKLFRFYVKIKCWIWNFWFRVLGGVVWHQGYSRDQRCSASQDQVTRFSHEVRVLRYLIRSGFSTFGHFDTVLVMPFIPRYGPTWGWLCRMYRNIPSSACD